MVLIRISLNSTKLSQCVATYQQSTQRVASPMMRPSSKSAPSTRARTQPSFRNRLWEILSTLFTITICYVLPWHSQLRPTPSTLSFVFVDQPIWTFVVWSLLSVVEFNLFCSSTSSSTVVKSRSGSWTPCSRDWRCELAKKSKQRVQRPKSPKPKFAKLKSILFLSTQPSG